MPQFDDHFIEAHRGASGAFPENTILAFRQAVVAGAQSIETDLSLLRDGSFAIFHDANLGRTVAGEAAIGTFDAESILQLDAGSWRGEQFAGEPVPSLAAGLAFQAETGVGFNWEIKCHNDDYAAHAKALARGLAGANPAKTLISSFDEGCLVMVRSSMPAAALALIAEHLPEDWQDIGQRIGLDGFHLNHEFLSADQVTALHAAGYGVRCYTVNDAEDVARLKAWDVDMVMTDWPEKFRPADA